MKIGEFFINLGFKGTDKALKAGKEINNTLGEIKTSGLAAKAGIVAMVYALERLMRNSDQTGQNLVSFAAATGLSLTSLQKWQYAAQQAGVSADEMKNSITHMQSAMINMAMGGGVPAGFGVISNAVGIDQSKIRDTEYMMRKLVEYARKEKNVDFANAMLESMGLSLDMIAAMRMGVFNGQNFKNAPMYSDKEARNLQKINVGWANLYQQFEMGMGHLNAKHGLQLIKALSEISKEVIKLGDALATLAEKSKFFLLLGDSLDAIVKLLRLMNGETLDTLAAEENAKPDKKHFGDGTWWKKGMDKIIDMGVQASLPAVEKAIPRSVKKAGAEHGTQHTTNHYAVTSHLHGVKDAKDAGHEIKKNIDRAGRMQKMKGR